MSVVEPPIDVDADHPGIDGGEFRRTYGVAVDEILVISVSRLSIQGKLDALVDAIDAVEILARDHRVRLILVGEGEARPQLEARAAGVNQGLGREVVTFTGSTMNPRPAYAAADVVVGMGSSALRALSIGKPVVVQGEGGFSLAFDPENLDTFLWQGFWGLGSGEPGGEQLAGFLRPLVTDSERRRRLGAYGRTITVERFSIARAAETIEKLYSDMVSQTNDGPGIRVKEPSVIAGRALRIEYEAHLPGNKRARAVEEASRLGSASDSGV